MQLASIERGIEQNTFTATDCTTVPGICRFTTVLQADVWFHASQGVLSIAGSATMGVIGGRRAEQVAPAGEKSLGQFSFDVQLVSAETAAEAATSSSSTMTGRFATALSALSVLALIL